MKTMHKTHSTLAAIAVATLANIAPLTAHAAKDVDANVDQARTMVKSLGSQLKARLQQAIATDGAPGAVSACNLDAPTITQSINTEGATIKRTSLKVRNPANAPDDWERQVLLQFQKRIEAGEDGAELEYFDLVDGGFRYMKPIMTGGLCVTCHGSSLAKPVQETINKHYPQDHATGFAPGEMRGAFSIQID